MTKKLGFKIDLEVSREFLDHARYPEDYLVSRVLINHRTVELLATYKNIHIEGPECIRDISDRVKGQRAGDLWKYTWFITAEER